MRKQGPLAEGKLAHGYLQTVKQTVTTVSKEVNTLRPKQNGRHFADAAIFKCIFLNENV